MDWNVINLIGAIFWFVCGSFVVLIAVIVPVLQQELMVLLRAREQPRRLHQPIIEHNVHGDWNELRSRKVWLEDYVPLVTLRNERIFYSLVMLDMFEGLDFEGMENIHHDIAQQIVSFWRSLRDIFAHYRANRQ